jgi:hypothetical protein
MADQVRQALDRKFQRRLMQREKPPLTTLRGECGDHFQKHSTHRHIRSRSPSLSFMLHDVVGTFEGNFSLAAAAVLLIFTRRYARGLARRPHPFLQ